MPKRFIILCLIVGLIAGVAPIQAQDTPLITHVVQPGENLYQIALVYGVTLDALMAANGLTVSDPVLVGQTLIIPTTAVADAGVIPPAPSVVTHTVQPGERLLQIARQYGVTLDDLIAANAIINPSLVLVGQVLVIPGVVAPGASDPAALTSPSDTDQPDSSDQPDLSESSDSVDSSVDSTDSRDSADATVDGAPEAAEAPEASETSNDPETVEASETAEVSDSETAEATQSTRDPSLETPDLGILPAAPEHVADNAPASASDSGANLVPESESVTADPSVSAPDLGIISPSGATWMVQPGIISLGDAQNVRAIYEHGQALGNNPHAFSTIGDCNSEPPFFLAKFDTEEYNLGEYAYLQPVIEQFAGSFNRDSMAVWTGNHAWAVFDPVWANPAFCDGGETPLDCEYRLQRPSLALIRLGTNEAGSTALFEENLRKIIEVSIEHGVIPVLGTKADRLEGSDAHNALVRRLAEEYGIPLWDFGKVADTLPGRGLMPDGFHMSYVPPDYTSAYALQTGHSVQNLLALMALNTVWRSAMY